MPKNFSLYTDAEDPADVSPVGRLTGHARKVGHVLFNPAAQNVLASSSGDFTVKLWDIEQGKDRLVLKHPEIVQSLSWSPDGAQLVTTSRDKKLRIWDTRMEKPAHEVPVSRNYWIFLRRYTDYVRVMLVQRTAVLYGWENKVALLRLVSLG